MQFDGKLYPFPQFSDVREAEYLNTITEEVQTPHLATATPYHGGPIGALFVVPRYSARPTVELRQRFDIRERYALIHRRGTLTDERGWANPFHLPGSSLEQIEEAFRQGLAEKPAVVILHDFTWSILPADMVREIARLAEAGTGIVLWGVTGSEPLPEALAHFEPDAGAAAEILSCVPAEAGHRFETLGAFSAPGDGGGRVVSLTPGHSQGLFSYLDDEDLYAVVGRAMLWAAGRAPVTGIDAEIEDGVVRAYLKGEAPPAASVEVAVYDPTAVLRHELVHAAEVQPGEALEWPPLKAGTYWVRVTLRSGERVVDWTTRRAEFTAPVAVEAISFEQEHVALDGEVRAKVHLMGETLEDYRLEYRLVDTYGRVIARGRTAAAAEVEIRAPVVGCLSPMCFLELELRRDGRAVAGKRAWFTVAQPPIDTEDFHAGLWSSLANRQVPRSIWGHRAKVMEKQMGIDFILTLGYPAAGAEWPTPITNMRPYVYAVNHQMGGTRMEEGRGGPMRRYCLTSDSWNRYADALIRERTGSTWRFSPVCYTNCGDSYLARPGDDVCFSDTCLASFRDYVRARYGTLDRLNAAWDTGWDDWAEVTPVTLEELEAWRSDPEPTEPSAGHYARWVEHRMHMETVYADRHRRDQEIIRQFDPRARTGLDAHASYNTSFAGFDFIRKLEFMGMIGPYANPLKYDLGRSLARPGTILGSWVGGGYPQYRSRDYARAHTWMLLFNRFNMHLFFTTYGGSGDDCPMLAPDLRPFPVMAEQVEQLREIRQGTGKLLLSARRENDGIAFLYSPASVHAATLTRGMPVAEFEATPGVAGGTAPYASQWLEHETANEALATLFKDMGFQFDYVTPGQVADGRLISEGFRVLVLPAAQAFSAEVADAVRSFAAAGGLVVADLRPGIFDETGRFLGGGGQLDDLFGIERAAGFPEPLLMRTLSPTRGNAGLPDLPVDHQVRATTASPLARSGDTPAFLERRAGRGRAILFNCYPGRYAALRAKGEEKPVRELVRGLMETAGVQPATRVSAAGSSVPTTEVVRFTHGDSEYVGVLRAHRLRWDEPVPIIGAQAVAATVDFGRSAHVYDVRARRYLGYHQRLTEAIEPARAYLYALLPYRTEGIRVSQTAIGPGVAREFELRVLTQGEAQPGTHVLHVEVEDALRRIRPEYARNLEAPAGVARFRLPLALSDPSGIWKLRVRDAATGVTGETTFGCLLSLGNPR